MEIYTGLYVNYALFSSDLMKYECSQNIFAKYTNIKFHENHSSASQVVPRGRRDRRTDGQTGERQDMAKLIAVLRNFANSSKYGRRYETILQAGLKFVVYI